MSIWSKITQGLGIGIQMAAPVVPFINPAAAAALKVAEAVVLAAQDATPEKAVEMTFNSLGVTLQAHEVIVLASVSRRVAQRMKTNGPNPTP